VPWGSLLGYNLGLAYHSSFPPICRLYLYMASLYFCQPHAQNQGMLRAVLDRDDCKHLAESGAVTYIGNQFPDLAQSPRGSRDFAVLKVTADEADAQWRCGFYRVDADLMELNARLLTLAQ
jgi:hypothetical protein